MAPCTSGRTGRPVVAVAVAQCPVSRPRPAASSRCSSWPPLGNGRGPAGGGCPMTWINSAVRRRARTNAASDILHWKRARDHRRPGSRTGGKEPAPTRSPKEVSSEKARPEVVSVALTAMLQQRRSSTLARRQGGTRCDSRPSAATSTVRASARCCAAMASLSPQSSRSRARGATSVLARSCTSTRCAWRSSTGPGPDHRLSRRGAQDPQRWRDRRDRGSHSPGVPRAAQRRERTDVSVTLERAVVWFAAQGCGRLRHPEGRRRYTAAPCVSSRRSSRRYERQGKWRRTPLPRCDRAPG